MGSEHITAEVVEDLCRKGVAFRADDLRAFAVKLPSADGCDPDGWAERLMAKRNYVRVARGRRNTLLILCAGAILHLSGIVGIVFDTSETHMSQMAKMDILGSTPALIAAQLAKMLGGCLTLFGVARASWRGAMDLAQSRQTRKFYAAIKDIADG